MADSISPSLSPPPSRASAAAAARNPPTPDAGAGAAPVGYDGDAVEAAQAPTRKQAAQEAARENQGIEAFEVPRTVLTRLVKGELPDNVKLQKEVILALTKASTVFINYLAATAQDNATAKSRKTIAAEDVLVAVRMAGLGDGMREELKKELEAYRALNKAKRSRLSAASTADAPVGKTTGKGRGKGGGAGKGLAAGKDKDKGKPPASGGVSAEEVDELAMEVDAEEEEEAEEGGAEAEEQDGQEEQEEEGDGEGDEEVESEEEEGGEGRREEDVEGRDEEEERE